jgi:hypothetical protein
VKLAKEGNDKKGEAQVQRGYSALCRFLWDGRSIAFRVPEAPKSETGGA